MGCYRWLAIRGVDRDRVLGRMGFTVVDELVEEVYDPGLYSLEVGDWLVVFGDGAASSAKVRRAEASALSADGDVVYLSTDDASMTFEIALFHERAEKWSITYDGGDGVSDPRFRGAAPWRARTLLASLEKQQAAAGGPKAGVDHLYELAPTFAMELVGFRHDKSLESGDHVPIWQLVA
nr:hypothetical protein [Kofleriaceae bacterium]